MTEMVELWGPQTLTVDHDPMGVRDQDVKRAHMFSIPVKLRAHACTMLDDLPGGQWFSVGEFQTGTADGQHTAVARRVLVDGWMTVQYGVEV
jgi:hypothetical protein